MPIHQLETPQPHYIPGYTGYCPQYIYRVGDTYGGLTHKLFIDPCVSHGEKLTLSNRSTDDYHVERPTLREIDVIRNRELEGDPIYKHPMIPGFEGFLPRFNAKFGQRFFVSATEGLAEYEQEMQYRRREERRIRMRTAVQDSSMGARSLGERSLQATDNKLPLQRVRPDCQGGLREIDPKLLPKAPNLPYSNATPPHFMDADNPEKYLKQGYAGKTPFLYHHFGQGSKPLSHIALGDFTNNYQHRRSAEWAPITNATIGIPQPKSPCYDIYDKTVGLIPNYAGHVPGAMFRFGKTFGNDSRNAKRTLGLTGCL